MKRMQSVGLAGALALALLVGCGKDDKPTPEPQPESHRCDPPTEYLAFDPANSAPQELQLERMDDILTLFDDAVLNPRLASVKGAQAQGLYQNADAQLQASVRSRQDLRADPAALVGPELDDTLSGAIEDLRKATTAYQVLVARKRLETSGFDRYLGWHQQEGQRAHRIAARGSQRSGREYDPAPIPAPRTGQCDHQEKPGSWHRRRRDRVGRRPARQFPRRSSRSSACRVVSPRSTPPPGKCHPAYSRGAPAEPGHRRPAPRPARPW